MKIPEFLLIFAEAGIPVSIEPHVPKGTDAKPKLMIAVDGFYKNGKVYLELIDEENSTYKVHGRYGELGAIEDDAEDLLNLNYSEFCKYAGSDYQPTEAWGKMLVEMGYMKIETTSRYVGKS